MHTPTASIILCSPQLLRRSHPCPNMSQSMVHCLFPKYAARRSNGKTKRACGRKAVTARSSFFLASRGSVRRFACRPGIRESNPIDERLAFPHWASMSLRYGTAVQQADPLSINLVVRRMATGLRVPGHRSPSTANSELTIGVPFLGMLTARSRKKER